MELTPYQTHASIALVGFGVSAGMAANVPLAAGCFGGLGAFHLFVLVRLALADWRYARERAEERRRASRRRVFTGNEVVVPSRPITLPEDRA